ncbi:hypothetical protein M440DRAFT_1161495 [Trichoderma longibrachiatum ATCC 18648]|uniref:Nephrocystin 3-like N-terminal domain-containing protein n=1 Tax=Trichoderma longibrachiatum ATCC 18648 TaxID=983965 RepID=A0A2T4CC91_TRILO|nr:hypothetical protein M440DRAFT_1161495 [Trichoderma longibrachiatum ATCC 18648]
MLSASLKGKWRDRWNGRAEASLKGKTKKRVGKIWNSFRKSPEGNPLQTARPSSPSLQGSSSQSVPPHLRTSLSPQNSISAATLPSSTSQNDAIIPQLLTSRPSTPPDPSLHPSTVFTTNPSIQNDGRLSSIEDTEEASPALDIEDIDSSPVTDPLSPVLITAASVLDNEDASSTAATENSSPSVDTEDISSPPATETTSPPPTTCPGTASTVNEDEAFTDDPLPVNLWEEVFRSVNDETKTWIKRHGLNSTPNADSDDQVKALIDLLENQSLLQNQRTPSKIRIGNQKIVFREYVADVISFLTMAGDLTATLVPRETSAPWVAGKALLKLPVQRAEQLAALAATIQWFTRIIRRGQVYELLYKASTTDGQAVSNLHSALLDLYIAAMEYLARSDQLIRSGKASQTLEVLLRPQQTADFFSDLVKKEQKVQLEAQACEWSRQAKAQGRFDRGIGNALARLDGLSSPVTRIDEGVIRLLEAVDRDRLGKLMDFVSSEKFGKSHATVSETRTANTGDWLIHHEGFRDWLAIPSSSTVLCLKGTVGTGKTYLTSRVIDHIKGILENSAHDEGFAFFYCSRSGPSMQDPLIVLRSLARQLCYRASDHDRIQKKVIEMYEVANKEGRDFGYHDCKELILDSLNLYSRTTIILDALDESDITTYNLAEILIDLVEKAAKPVKLFISSRPDRQYMDAFDNKATIAIDSSTQRGDIDKYLHEQLYSTRIFRDRKEEIQGLIRETFASRSGGMFRWVYLQVQRLRSCTSDDAIRLWANTIPPDLMGTYDQLWEGTRAQRNEHDIALAERAVQWVLCSLEPLTSPIFLEAIRYAFEGDRLVEKERQSEQEILSLCQDLLTIDEQRQVWMLSHASVAEYFESKGLFLGKCDAFVARISLNFLMQFEWEPWYVVDPSQLVPISSFGEYAAHTWPRHVQQYDKWLSSAGGIAPDAKLVMALKQFLGSPGRSSEHYRAWLDKNHICTRWSFKPDLLPNNMALFTMCRYGLYNVLRDWWHEGSITEDMALSKCAGNCNALGLAALAESVPICRVLLRVMDINNPLAEGHYRAMKIAIGRGNRDIVSLLVSEGRVDLNVEFKDSFISYTPVQWMIMRNLDLLPWSLAHGWVDVNRQAGSCYGNALTAAVCRGSPQAVRILLDAGADANAAVECGIYGSALVAAASRVDESQVEIMRLLVDHGADVKLPLRSGQYGSPLEALFVFSLASEDRRENLREALKFLLEAGADPAVTSGVGRHGSALAAAAWLGHKDMLALMIDVVGRERAVECLGRSRHPEAAPFFNKEGLEAWKQQVKETVAYLRDEVGVDDEILHKVGLWPVESGEVGMLDDFESRYHKALVSVE